MYTLYYAPGAASMAVHWMLIELGVPFELVTVDFETKAQKSAAYLRLNPSGLVPTLVIEGVPYAECAGLLMLLAERHPQARLAPGVDSPERAAFLQWMLYLANTLQPAFRNWFYPDEPAGPENVDAAKRQARAKIESAWERLDALLQDGRPFLVGTRLSAVDFLATMLARWSRNMPKTASAYPNLGAYVDRMRTLPSLREVHAREKLTDWIDS